MKNSTKSSIKRKKKEKCEWCQSKKPRLVKYECTNCGATYCNACTEKYCYECTNCPPPELVKINSNN